MRAIFRSAAALPLLISGCVDAARTQVGDDSWSSIDVRTEAALGEGDYQAAIDGALARAEAGDVEWQFFVGYLFLEWLDDEDAKEAPRHTAREGLDWIRKAASGGSRQAAETLRSAYEWGRHTLPRDPKMMECWRAVELGEETASACLREEVAKDGAR